MTTKTPITLEDLKPLCKRLKLAALYEHANVLQEQPETLLMSHVEWLHQLLIAETSRRDSNALKRRLSIAELEFKDCCMEGIDYEINRGLDRQMMAELGTCDWIRKHQNCIITGKTGCGKTWVAGALVHAACMQGFSAKCVRISTLLRELEHFREIYTDYKSKIAEITRYDVLLIDEWGHANLNATNRSDLLDIINDRCGKKSTIIVGAMPVKDWASFIGDKSMADSIMDRLVRSSHRINLEGISMRSLERYGAVVK